MRMTKLIRVQPKDPLALLLGSTPSLVLMDVIRLM